MKKRQSSCSISKSWMRKIDKMLANKNGAIPDFSFIELDEEKYHRASTIFAGS
jgi:hypothetical protein